MSKNVEAKYRTFGTLLFMVSCFEDCYIYNSIDYETIKGRLATFVCAHIGLHGACELLLVEEEDFFVCRTSSVRAFENTFLLISKCVTKT